LRVSVRFIGEFAHQNARAIGTLSRRFESTARFGGEALRLRWWRRK